MEQRVEIVQDSYLEQSLAMLDSLTEKRKTLSKAIKELKEDILLYCLENFKNVDELKVETRDRIIYTLELKPNVKFAINK